MKELRKDEELTTADLAGRGQKSRETEDGPQLVHNQPRERSEYPLTSTPLQPSDEANLRAANQGSTFANETAKPFTSTDPTRPIATGAGNQTTPLFAESEVGDFRSRWSNIQTGFVDEPRRAVEDADNLVASLMKKLAEGFANERSRLEKQWDRGDDVSTEDLRLALQRYRSFFDRLLKV
ncbi:MAG: hypothetical protein WBM04_04995 [Candidatus Korobacteraceae bacterium]